MSKKPVKVNKVRIELSDKETIFADTLEEAKEKVERIQNERLLEISRQRCKVAYEACYKSAYIIVSRTLLNPQGQCKPSWYFVNSAEALNATIEGGDSDGYGRMLVLDTEEAGQSKTDEDGIYFPKPKYRLAKHQSVVGLIENGSGWIIGMCLRDSDTNDDYWMAVASFEGELEVMSIPDLSPKYFRYTR